MIAPVKAAILRSHTVEFGIAELPTKLSFLRRSKVLPQLGAGSGAEDELTSDGGLVSER
jgi:hypothetical protein